MVAEELRLFGDFNRLEQFIAALPTDVPGMFHAVLDRVEQDHGHELVARWLALVATGRDGLLESELLELLARGGEDRLPAAVFARVYRSLSAYLKPRAAVGGGEEGLIDFFHRQLAKVVADRYLPEVDSQPERHRELAGYFHRKLNPHGADPFSGNYPRGLAELPYHQIQGQAWQDLETTLTDLRFVQAKCVAGMTFDLVRDYNAALAALPELESERRQEQERIQRLRHYSDELIAYARARGQGIPLPEPPDTGALRAATIALAESESQSGPARAEQVRAFANFVSAQSHVLSAFPRETIVVARNSACGGAVAAQAEPLADTLLRPWLARDPRPLTPAARPQCQRTLCGHDFAVLSVAITPDGRRAISASRDGTLKVWDLASGADEKTLLGHTSSVNCVAITSDGRRAVSASKDKTLKVWDLKSGAEEMTLDGHADSVNSVAITPDGRRAVSASEDETLKVWDLESGHVERTLEGHSGSIWSVAITPDGRRVVSVSWDNTLKVWDLESGDEEKTLHGHTNWVHSVAITADGRRTVSGSFDNTLKVWDLESGDVERTLRGHTGAVLSLAITPDGRRAVSASRDHTLKVWDLESGDVEEILQGHTDSVHCVAITADGRRAVSGSGDNKLKVWDLASGAEEQTLHEHTCGVWSVAITPDGRRAVSASEDQTLKVWDLESGAEGRNSPGPHRLRALCSDHGGWPPCRLGQRRRHAQGVGLGERCRGKDPPGAHARRGVRGDHARRSLRRLGQRR